MSVVIEFQELVQRRERRQAREVERRCVEIVEAGIETYEGLLADASELEREVYGRRVRQLSDLLNYMVPRIRSE